MHYNWNRYYDPSSGRYLSPDPLGIESDIALYTYAQNNPLKFTDPTGLAVWICNRKAEGIVGTLGGNHAYLWDDRNGSACGMRGSSGSGGNSGQGDIAPTTRLNCRKVPGSEGKEDDIMNCCRNSANNGVWYPPFNDCHEAADDCIKKQGLKNPKAPGGRIGEPCDPCPKSFPWANT